MKLRTHPSNPSPPRRWRGEQRPGITLLEVVIAMAILLFSSVAIFSLVQMGSDRAIDVQYHARASMLCQSKLEELKIGSESLNAVDWTPFKEKEASAYQYSIDVNDGDMTGIKEVKVSVKRERADGRVIEVALNQLILDPAVRGNTFDRLNASASGTTPSGGTTP
ncbi:MAG: type II secretion system GspH family protein [Gemmataceae bacterium]|nr:type II secretion system GspH family protein [Gemmataceae bacterium]